MVSTLPRWVRRSRALAVLARLLKVGSMTESLAIYIPATLFQKAVGLGRVILFVYLLKSVKAQYGLWGLGVMIFTLACPIVTLGSYHGLIRYVSFYEARHRLAQFYRRTRWYILVCAGIITAIFFLASGSIARLVFTSRYEVVLHQYRQQLYLCILALSNGTVLALYHNVRGFLVGMRLYRVVSFLEVFFAIIFTAVGAMVLMLKPQADSLLWAHLFCIAAVFIVGLLLLERAVGVFTSVTTPTDGEVIADVDSSISRFDGTLLKQDERIVDASVGIKKGFFWQVLQFGFISTLAGFVWQGAGYISFLLTSRYYGKAKAAVFFAFLPFGQAILSLADAVRIVLFTHVAKLWESHQRHIALIVLETSYKALVLGTMSITVLIYATSPLWVKIFPMNYHDGLKLLGGILMFFQVGIHLSLVNIIARLHERPIIIAFGPLIGGVVNTVLAVIWLPYHGPAGAAWAAGLGMFTGAMIISVGYFLAERVKLNWSTYFILAVPILLALPKIPLCITWTLVIIMTIFTTWVLNAREKKLIISSLMRITSNTLTLLSKRGRRVENSPS